MALAGRFAYGAGPQVLLGRGQVNPLIRNFLLIALVAVVVVTLLPARARAETTAEGDFILETFPHAGSDVRFRDTWGARRSGGRRHKGTDILSPRGTPILAVAPGVVVFVGKQRLSGYTVKIEHAEGWVSTYMHLNNDTPGTDDGKGGPEAAFAPGMEVGTEVQTGQLIGWVGDSGNAERTTTHTHFELKHNGTKLNPYPYLVTAWRLRSSDGDPAAE